MPRFARQLHQELGTGPLSGCVTRLPQQAKEITFDVVLQVFTPAAAALFVVTGVGLFYYFQYEKRKLQEKKGSSRTQTQHSANGLEIVFQRRSSSLSRSDDPMLAVHSRSQHTRENHSRNKTSWENGVSSTLGSPTAPIFAPLNSTRSGCSSNRWVRCYIPAIR